MELKKICNICERAEGQPFRFTLHYLGLPPVKVTTVLCIGCTLEHKGETLGQYLTFKYECDEVVIHD